MTTTRMPVVYRCFDAAGRLIYIGSTEHAERRLIFHRSQAWWHSLVARISYEVHDDMDAAFAAEHAAIRAERPAFNVLDRRGRSRHYQHRLTDADLRVCREWVAAGKSRSVYLPGPVRALVLAA